MATFTDSLLLEQDMVPITGSHTPVISEVIVASDNVIGKTADHSFLVLSQTHDPVTVVLDAVTFGEVVSTSPVIGFQSTRQFALLWGIPYGGESAPREQVQYWSDSLP